ncbi:epoxide hydrolase 3 isoform X1 [Mustela putorius furo]|uniref:Epoxide hydrolase 3 isoform X1 n=1 Tax=Mustela putorius furo TaxID=9669 RepID=A0A8U0SZA2_MUSPF|nr:epoxide hydrolase 3 isoform X1 [Mustela putorius furo]
MPELVVTALLAPSRLSLKLLRAFMWSLVFSAALVAAAVYGCIAFTHVLCRPRRGCCGRPRSAPPACVSDPTLGEHCFLTLKSSGLRLHYVSAGRGNGPLMLFLHGFPENWFSWRYQLWEFQSRFHVVAVDLRGYGPSDAPRDVDCYTMDLLMTDIQDIILGLGYSRCILVAHDWGALIAWNFSIYYPSLVERMVIVSAAPMSVYQGTSPWSPRSLPPQLCCCGERRTPTSSRGWWEPSAVALCPAGWRPISCQAWGTGSHRATLGRCMSTCGPSCKTCWTSGPRSLACVHLGDPTVHVHGWTPGLCTGVELEAAPKGDCGGPQAHQPMGSHTGVRVCAGEQAPPSWRTRGSSPRGARCGAPYLSPPPGPHCSPQRRPSEQHQTQTLTFLSLAFPCSLSLQLNAAVCDRMLAATSGCFGSHAK